MLVEGGGELLTLKRNGGGRSSGVAKVYIEGSLAAELLQETTKLFSIVKNILYTVTSSKHINMHEDGNRNETPNYFGVNNIFENDEIERFGHFIVSIPNNNNIKTQAAKITCTFPVFRRK